MTNEEEEGRNIRGAHHVNKRKKKNLLNQFRLILCYFPPRCNTGIRPVITFTNGGQTSRSHFSLSDVMKNVHSSYRLFC